MRRYGSPVLVMRPKRALPPELYGPGTSPSQAASGRPLLKSWPLPIIASNAVAVVSPTPLRRMSCCARASSRAPVGDVPVVLRDALVEVVAIR